MRASLVGIHSHAPVPAFCARTTVHPGSGMSRIVLGIYDDAGPVLIRSNRGARKPTSQDMAVLGSVMVYSEGVGYSIGSITTEECRVSFHR